MASRRFSILTFGTALVSGIGLWVYVSLTRTYEDYLVVPFVVVAPPNQALLSAVPSEITVRVRASGLQLLNVKYFTKSVTCTLDLRHLRPTGPSAYTAEQPDLLRSIVSAIPLRMLSVAPAELLLTTGDLAIKRIPLTILHTITCRQGFVLASAPHTEQLEVEVRGTRSIVEKLQGWNTQWLSLDDVHESATLELPVSDTLMAHVNVTPSRVRVHIDVQQVADAVISDVPLTLASSTGSAALSISPVRVTVVIRGGVESVAAITAKDLRAEIIERPRSGYARPHVTAPSSVQVIAIRPPFVRVRRRD